MLGEYDSLDNSQREYIYLENMPVAVMTQGTTQNGNQYYFTGNDPAHNLSATVLLDVTNKTAVVDAPGNNLMNVFYDFNLTGNWHDKNKYMQNVLVTGYNFDVSLSPGSNLLGEVYFPASGPEGFLEITRPDDWMSFFNAVLEPVSDVITVRNVITGQTASVQFDETSQTLTLVDNTGVMSGSYPLGTGYVNSGPGTQFLIIDYNDTSTKISGYIMISDGVVMSFLIMEKWNEPRYLYTLTGNKVAQSNSVGNTLHYIYTDHLGTPREVIDPATNTVVWRWDRDPFGTTAANDDPDGDGVAFALNLRFAGQYYDSETGLHYNLMRYYDPGTGRYLTSDPIGLGGGLNTYTYVSNNPILYIDPWGLAQCTYSISTHTLVCRPNDPGFVGPPLPLGPAGVSSGVGQCKDNPKDSCTDSSFRGPIPSGEYNMNPDNRSGHEQYWRLEPNPPVSWWEYYLGIKRSGFLLHPGTRTLGCINADKFSPTTMNQYNRIHELLKSESGSNTLTVTP